MAEAVCVDWSGRAQEILARLPQAERRTVLRAGLFDLRRQSSPDTADDRISPDPPWRWHLVDDRVIEYRDLTASDSSSKCPHGGFFVGDLQELGGPTDPMRLWFPATPVP